MPEAAMYAIKQRGVVTVKQTFQGPWLVVI